MWYTSYYNNKQLIPTLQRTLEVHPLYVSISRTVMDVISRKFRNINSYMVYKDLAPPWELVENYKNGKITQEEYTKQYKQLVLDTLDPFLVIQELEGVNNNVVLLCHEKSDDFCHRHIVSKWLKENEGLEIVEFKTEKPIKDPFNGEAEF